MTKYAYTFGGQLWTEDGPWNDDTVTNTFNNRLRVDLDLKQPTGVWTNKFTYDASRRLTNVTSKAGSFSYLLAVGAPSTLTVRLGLPNGSYITNTYDSVARLAGTWLKNSTHTTLNSHQYSYNLGNQRTQQVFNTPWSTVNYAYDPIGQLKVADSGTANEDRAYDYDSAWNLTNRTVNTTPHTFQVDGLNQLTNSTPGGVSAYDGNGNLVSSGATALEYAYDDENRLSIVQSNTVFYSTNYPLWQTLYAYDGFGRLRLRVERQNMVMPDPGGGGDLLVIGEETTLESGAGVTWSTNSITRYVYDSWRVIQERNGSNNVPTVSYTRGTDLSGTLEGAGGIGGLLARSHGYSSGNWSTHNSYHADGNGNVTYLVAANQGQAARYRYDPYGNVISLAENVGFLGTPSTYRFSSKMVDLKTGLNYYGYRWYSANLQRWVNRDPIAEAGGINLYGFVANTPIDHADCLGLDLIGNLPGNPNGIGSGIGSVSNGSTNSYPGMASSGQHGTPTACIIGPNGRTGGGTNLLNDLDFIFPTPANPINSKTNGAFKIGSNEAMIVPDPKAGMTNNVKITNFDSWWPPMKSTNLPGYPK